MHLLEKLFLSLIAGTLSHTSLAESKAITGVFQGTGRACSGTLHIEAKSIKWNSAFSTCSSTRYAVLEKSQPAENQRTAFLLKKASNNCHYKVIEVERAEAYNWTITGYQTEEAFQKRNLPDWANSPLPERQTLSCLMIKGD